MGESMVGHYGGSWVSHCGGSRVGHCGGIQGGSSLVNNGQIQGASPWGYPRIQAGSS